MFPIPWNFPFRKKNGDLSTISDVINSGGGGGSDLPPHDIGDAGKLLGVDSAGKLEWTDDVSSEIQTLTNNVSDINTALSNEIATRAKVSGHNLLPNNTVSGTYGGAQFTVNADKSVTISQTTEGNVAVSLTDSLKLEAGYYILSGGIDDNCVVDIQVDGQYYSSTGEDTPFTVGANSTIGFVRLTIYGARAVSGTFYPMIRLATDESSDYEPYAKTNQELTDNVDNLSEQLSGNYIFVELGHKVTITADGVKTASALYEQLANAVIAYAQGLESNVRIMIDRLNLYKGNHFPTVKGPYANNMASFDISAYYIDLNSSGTLIFRHSRVSSITANNHEYVGSMGVGSAYSFSDISSDVVPSGTELSVTFGVYKSVTI